MKNVIISLLKVADGLVLTQKRTVAPDSTERAHLLVRGK